MDWNSEWLTSGVVLNSRVSTWLLTAGVNFEGLIVRTPWWTQYYKRIKLLELLELNCLKQTVDGEMTK